METQELPQSQLNHRFFSNSILALLATLIILVGLVIALSYQLFLQKNQSPCDQSVTPTPTIVSETQTNDSSPLLEPTIQPVEVTSDTTNWIRTRFKGPFDYEYPASWHVAELWGMGADQSILLAMDPEPLSLAPRGGPIATIEATVINGKPNPNEILQQKIAEIKLLEYTNVTSENLSMSHGEVYHFKGEITGEFMGGAVIEHYIFSLNESPSDPLNQQTIKLSTFPKSTADSARLRHIAESFTEIN